MGERTSYIPEELIRHILSFLPTKQAVATSVLSKRLKPLWRSVPTLDFSNVRSNKSYAHFVGSVYAFIVTRDQNQPIDKFRLKCSSGSYDPSIVKVWFNVAVQLKVQHFELSIFDPQFRKNSTNLSAILTCSTLVVLKLEGLELKEFSYVDLPLLKVLHLDSMLFSECGCLDRLLSGCPALEEFQARRLWLRKDFTDREFKTSPKLVRADISMEDSGILLMKVVNNVKFLRIQAMSFIYISRYDFPKFHNLTHIELGYNSRINNWLTIVELLKHCPKLQVLVIDQNQNRPHSYGQAFDGIEDVESWQYAQSVVVPECILLHLNRCYINDYRGTKDEFQFARYIMQNGRSLKIMTICSSITVGQPGKLKMFEKLSSCTKSSTTCKYSFE